MNGDPRKPVRDFKAALRFKWRELKEGRPGESLKAFARRVAQHGRADAWIAIEWLRRKGVRI